MAQARSARVINQREKTSIRAGKETSQSQAEGSTATKIAVPKFQKLNLLAVKFEIVTCKIFSVQVHAIEMT